MGVVPERTTEGYYRVAMPLTIRFSGEYEDIANVQFSRTFTLYSGSKVTFCLYNSLILTTDAYSYLAQEFEGIPVEKETIELKLGLNTSYQTYVTFKAGTEYSVYLSQARGSFKTSVKGEIPTNANAAGDTWNQLFQISVDGGATWLAGTNNYSSLFKWNTSGSYPVLIRLNRAAPEGEELPARLVNYEVSVNGIALNEANGYQTEIELTVAAQTAALVWSPVGGETVANATFAYTGTAQGFKAIFSSTDFSYEIRYYMTDASGKRIEGNTAIVPGTYTITAYAVADDGSEIPLSQLNLTNRTVTMTIIARDMVGESPTIEGIEDVVYDGNSHTPEFTVTWNGMELDLGNDYTFEVVDALNAGTASVIIRFMGNYTGTITREFDVTARNLEKEALVAQVDDVTYTGTAFEPQPAVTWNGKTLILGSDYTLSYEGNRNAGTASVTVTFIGNFTGSIVREFEIAKADYENISHDAVEAVYRPGIRLGDLTLEDGFRWADPAALIYAGEGEYQAIYNADPDNYNDFTLTIAVNVEQADSSFEIEYTRPDVIYMGGALPNLSLKEGGTAGTIAWDPYTLKPGTADYGWTFTPDDENYRTVRGTYSFTVSEKVIERIEVSFASQQEIAYGVTYDDLRKGLTVTAFYSDGSSRSVDAAYCELNGSLNAGSNTITVVYSGKSAAFEITVEKAVPTVIPVYDTPDVIYTSGSLPELTLGEGSVSGTIDWDSYTLEAGTFEFGWTFTPDDLDNYEILKGSVSFTITPVLLISIEAEYTGAPAFVYGISLDDVRGAITVTAYYNDGTSEIVTDYQVNTGLSEDIFPAGNHSFEIAFGDQTDTLNVEIAAREIADVAEISGDEDQIYTGAQVKPELTVALEGAGLVSGRDYQVAYGENLNVGKGTATVTFIGNYSGTVKIEFAIAARDLSGEAQVGIPVWAIFTGDAIRPVPEVTWKGGALAAGRDYELSYGENIHAGEGSVTVTFLGNFTGKISRTFRIARAAAVGMTAEIPDQNFTQGGCRPAFDVYLGSTLLPQDEYTVEYFDNLEAGVAYALVTFVRDYVGTLVVPFRILETEQAALPVEEPVKSQPIRVPVQTKTAEQLPAFVLPQGGSGKDEEQIEWNPIG